MRPVPRCTTRASRLSRPAELAAIDIEISILTLPERLEFKSPEELLAKLRPHVDGVVLRVGRHGSTYLPQVWEQLPDKESFLSHLAEKAGLAATDWKSCRRRGARLSSRSVSRAAARQDQRSSSARCRLVNRRSSREVLLPWLAVAALTNRRSAPVIVGLGFSAFVTQVVMMRELVSVLAGNELIYGIVLGDVAALDRIGLVAGHDGRSAPSRAAACFSRRRYAVAVLPVVSVFLLRTLRNVVFLRGAALGVTETVIVCVVCLAPYCLLIGYLLALASALVPGGKEARGIGRVYFLDCVGGVIAGLVFSFVLVIWLDHFQILYVAAAVNSCCASWACLAMGSAIGRGRGNRDEGASVLPC